MIGIKKLPVLTYLALLACPAVVGFYFNNAERKPATQSTSHPKYGRPENAVDGKVGTLMTQCTSTDDFDSNPNRWFRVFTVTSMDLLEVQLSSIRGFGDYSIYATYFPFDPFTVTPKSSDLCDHRPEGLKGGSKLTIVSCRSEMQKVRYITLVVHTDTEPLNLCELMANGDEPTVDWNGIDYFVAKNVAENKPAMQSTLHAVDGKPERAARLKKETKCSRTSDKDFLSRWYRLDLLGPHNVMGIAIKTDETGMTDFDIFVTDYVFDPYKESPPDSVKCVHRDVSIEANSLSGLLCDKTIRGRYVTLVQNSDNQTLSLCTVKVYGEQIKVNGIKAVRSVSVNKPTKQSTTINGDSSSQAVDDTWRNDNDRFCTHTDPNDLNSRPWWRVDLQGLYDVVMVTIVNRAALAHFEIFVTRGVYNPYIQAPTDSEMCLRRELALDIEEIHPLPCTRNVTGRYVTLVLNPNAHALVLCEVEVKGTLNHAATIRDCTSWGTSFTKYANSRLENQVLSVEKSAVSFTECKDACLGKTACLSFTRTSENGTMVCYMHYTTAASYPEDFVTGVTDSTYFQRTCNLRRR